MKQFQQEVVNEVVRCILGIINCVGFLSGYALARIRSLGEFFESIVDNMIEGYSYGQTQEA